MKSKLPKPFKEAIIYQNNKLYICLANYPIIKGHTIIVWKKEITDLHLMSNRDYSYLMDTVNSVRDALLKTLKVKKVYLVYMDEIKHVHWHLVPRYKMQGFGLFLRRRKKLKNFSLVKKIKKNLIFD